MNSLHDRSFVDAVCPIPWSEFRAEFMSAYTPPTVAKTTASKMKQVLDEVDALDITPDGVPHVEGAKPMHIESTCDLTVTLIARYVASRPPSQSPYTLHGLLATPAHRVQLCRDIWTCSREPISIEAVFEGGFGCQRSTAAAISQRPRSRPVLDLMHKDVESKTGWSQWRARLLLITVLTIAYTGMRKNECLRLQVADVDLALRAIWIRPHGGKALKTAASEGPVPIPACAPRCPGHLACPPNGRSLRLPFAEGMPLAAANARSQVALDKRSTWWQGPRPCEGRRLASWGSWLHAQGAPARHSRPILSQ